MCGIAGWMGPPPTEAAPRLAAMAKLLAHRGPDGEGTWLDDRAALVHRRLSVIDINTGAQPLWSHDDRFVIVFNGEIYNYRELRQILEAEGHRFSTSSDTEVIIEIFRKEGIPGFSRLRGMYAFALWDTRTHRGFLVRDPYGIKPLFICQSGPRLLFASEAKAILAAGHAADLDVQSLHLVMNFRYLPGSRTLFRGVRQLQPGEIIEWHCNEKSHHSISLPQPSSKPLLAQLDSAVDRHRIADVEVGAYLSGGVDSALICALAARQVPGQLRTFTLPVGDDPKEAEHAAATAAWLGVENVRGEAHAATAAEMARLLWHLEVPKVNAWQVHTLARHARRYVKVTLSGLGADELFYGYNAHSIMDVMFRANRLARYPAQLAGKALTGLSALRNIQWSEPERLGLMLTAADDWPRVYGLLRNVWDSPSLRTLIYGPRMLDAAPPDAFEAIRNGWPTNPDPVLSAVDFEWRNKMVNDLLWQEDRASMAVGLEVRVPYLDPELVESVRRIPRHRLMRHGRRKALMRDAAREILPSAILNRRKSGFQVEASRFVAIDLSTMLDEWLSPERVAQHGLFSYQFIRYVRQQQPSGTFRWHYFMLYLMMQTHMWIEIFENRATNFGPAIP